MAKGFSVREQTQIRFCEEEILNPELGLEEEESRLNKNDRCRVEFVEPSYDPFDEFEDIGLADAEEEQIEDDPEDYYLMFNGDEQYVMILDDVVTMQRFQHALANQLVNNKFIRAELKLDGCM
ncbi:MAG: hypothetical protein COX77_01230 [Candidatus Komeilibacteria bacterium CG_4_10_14_0_2_um_filter_37_10]|uniref:Uncharacterized protein n=1 Tax=Candidatus Komeilibacteria bacterium CG_4_10_14_0_2_um_filter_37_10 TaxID=1974470 RepID=A0A2M7VG23_9BACT|nr:MAG: hypothetical protein COX77_01230 [Candidatus Komeilibacteria bacterium CG_4_10_14_0_2_um_filter_37_10]PJA92582.1 MAG: hypothetical protein CO133_02395 [Candidatus Komeilibacteria bacterium CG_4_9_14_3_um_filter_37_5]